MVRKIKKNDVALLKDIYNNANKKDLFYKDLSHQEFISKFYENKSFNIVTYVYDDGQIKGFISGVKGKDKAYITYIYVLPKYRNNNIGNSLYNAIYEEFKGLVVDMVFFNPAQLPWLIEDKFLHPNAPGIDIEGLAFNFFLNKGFTEFARQNVYFKNLSNFSYTPAILESFKRLEKDNITFGFYDYHQDTGIVELMASFNNEGWRKEIINHIDTYKEKNTVIVAKDGNKAIGFTGPIKNVDGRGYFAGIGVHSDYRSKGIGKALFNKLCHELKAISDYMTLFTGVNNKARYIYESAGFEIVKVFANLRRQL